MGTQTRQGLEILEGAAEGFAWCFPCLHPIITRPRYLPGFTGLLTNACIIHTAPHKKPSMQSSVLIKNHGSKR